MVVGRGPPFAYWRKVGLQAYTKICSGVLCNIVVNIVIYCTFGLCLLSVRLRGDNVSRAAAQDMYMYCFVCGVDELGMARPSHCCSGFRVAQLFSCLCNTFANKSNVCPLHENSYTSTCKLNGKNSCLSLPHISPNWVIMGPT